MYMGLIYRFDLARKVPIDGETTFADLTDNVGVDCAALTSVLRLGIAHRVFKEPCLGVIAHSATSRLS